ncbi:DUF6958 family protein [Rhizobium leguminosarum]|uniref:DUF6958 family protein n=1 Tax=Rhizobium leguminosarum TaxID=384 RepID=UPI0039656ED9
MRKIPVIAAVIPRTFGGVYRLSGWWLKAVQLDLEAKRIIQRGHLPAQPREWMSRATSVCLARLLLKQF